MRLPLAHRSESLTAVSWHLCSAQAVLPYIEIYAYVFRNSLDFVALTDCQYNDRIYLN